MNRAYRIRCNNCFEDAVDEGVCSVCGEDQEECDRDRRALHVGTEVYQKYTVGKVLGSGGFGITYLALDSRLARRVALKEYFPVGLVTRGADGVSLECFSEDERAPFRRGLDRFFREGQILAKFDHPNIIRVHEVFQANGTAYLAMEFLGGMTLKRWIDSSGGLELAKALKVMDFILEALKEVHKLRVVHRDVKPDNVYITHHGRTLLLDFGGAKQLTGDGDKSVDAMFAHGYAAPEQYFADSGKVGPWTDVYGCGATLYKMLTGRTMRSALDRYSDDSQLTWGPADIPASLRDTIRHAVQLKQADRYQTIDALCEALDASRPSVSAHAQWKNPTQEEPEPEFPPAPAPKPRRETQRLHEVPPHERVAPEAQVEVPPSMAAVAIGAARWKRPLVAAAIALCGTVAFFEWRPKPMPQSSNGTVLVAKGEASTATAVPAPAAAPAPATATAAAVSAPAPSADATAALGLAINDLSALTRQIDSGLDSMIEGAAAENWQRVNESAISIRDAQAKMDARVVKVPSPSMADAQEAIERGDYATAATLLKEITAKAPRDWNAWSALGYASLRSRKLSDARQALSNALRLKPNNAGAWAHLGEVLSANTDTATASLASLRLSVYFSPDRESTLKLLRSTSDNRIRPEFQSIIRSQGSKLEQIPEMKK
ncbi:serine/threonine-protein kinase [Variovorax saccharolyticus]|uniref:serine/threonine-protein kinase n=1 Tax=Variovorax saccharolyticus TaxID=3053516 RepID=UPI002575B596|nr:serine/threonine-protein kinase [Variovorax sp. J31P216]MDM0029583.1 protein kinase [Variovorax sp. J31P216]